MRLLFCEETSKGGLADFVAYGHPSIMLKSDEGSLVVGSHGMGDKEMMGFLGLIIGFGMADHTTPTLKQQIQPYVMDIVFQSI
mgnify:CR=1 FL=1